MDSSIDNFDFTNALTDLPDDVEIKTSSSNSNYRPKNGNFQRGTRPPLVSLDHEIWICGSKEKTLKRLKELEAAGDKNGIINLQLIKDEDIDTLIGHLKTKMVDILNGQAQIPIGDSRFHKSCHFKLACEKGFDGEHGFSHPIAAWLIWHLMGNIYTINKRSTTDTTKPTEAEEDELTLEPVDDIWNVQDDNKENEKGYRHQHPELPFKVVTEARKHTDTANKLNGMFSNVLIDFFAGKRGVPRIGLLKAPPKSAEKYQTRFCKGPFCYRTLMASNQKEATTACNSFHTDEVSFLTSLARILVDCHKMPKQAYIQHKEPYVKKLRALVTKKLITKVQQEAPPTKLNNAFEALKGDDDDDEPESEIQSDEE